MHKICKTCIHKNDWFINQSLIPEINTTYKSPFQNIIDADTGDKQVFISRKHPCFGCKYIFEDDHYEEDLKRCPFCGGEAKLISLDRGDSPGEDYSIECSKCAVDIGSYETKYEAIAAWNKRL